MSEKESKKGGKEMTVNENVRKVKNGKSGEKSKQGDQ